MAEKETGKHPNGPVDMYNTLKRIHVSAETRILIGELDRRVSRFDGNLVVPTNLVLRHPLNFSQSELELNATAVREYETDLANFWPKSYPTDSKKRSEVLCMWIPKELETVINQETSDIVIVMVKAKFNYLTFSYEGYEVKILNNRKENRHPEHCKYERT